MKTTPPPIIDVAKEIPEFASLARETVRLHPRQGQTDIASSKMGGDILWPAKEPWPICEEHQCNYVPVLQLNAKDLPKCDFRPGFDLLQLLWCPRDHELHGFAPHSRIIWRNTATIGPMLDDMPKSEGGEKWYKPFPCVLNPEIVVEYPDVMDISPEKKQLLNANKRLKKLRSQNSNFMDDQVTVYQYWLSVADGTKLGGYPHWIQFPKSLDCNCGRPMEYLLTVASTEYHGGSWQRWLPLEEQKIVEPKILDGIHRPAQLMLGDDGNINYFVCKTCEAWPVKSVFACS